MQHFDDLLSFAGRAMARPLHMRAEAGESRVTVTVDTSDGGYRVLGRPRYNNPTSQEQFDAELSRLSAGERVNLSLTPVKPLRFSAAKVGWLRVAYIVAFAALGYRYAASRDLDAVRSQLSQPRREVVRGFWAHNPRATPETRQLGLLQLGAEVQSVVVQIGPHIIFLPVPGCGDVYAHLSQKWGKGTHFQLQADLIPWPESLVLDLDA